ncbi:hypothetical protein ACG74X_21180, partial [Marivita sp. S0852]|uniref:hypothetical protein n=1 Tax=Marivita sp. S0852 TaxID=3373893 RepID=UPI003981BE27
EGGVVIIQPEAVDLEGDEFTKLTTGTHELTISSQVTIVRIQYPRDGTFVYRFRSANEQRYPVERLKGGRIGVGQAKDVHPDTREIEEIPKVLTHHSEIPGGNWTEHQSRERNVNLPMGFLEFRYDCAQQSFALICDAVDGDERR